ncbi:MAG: PstS family phosphate ABC transporter substrate-binding protein [Thermoleophilia bacterium]|nr:PstS family phosphate ABC transporter substrate-binding protein [Thermoleophilia bacterium]
MRRLGVLALLSCLLLAGAACGRELPDDDAVAPGDEIQEEEVYEEFEEEALTGRVRVDGSSTVAPYVTLAAERFRKKNPDVKVTVGISGTGGGLERFCAGETDLANASRPIKDEERAACEKKRIRFIELQVANDGLSVVVNPENDWTDCLSIDQLKAIWKPGSDVDNWAEIASDFPDEKLTLYGAGTDSGTFDFFTETVVGEEGESRSDYTATEDDNVTVRGVSGEKGALGYLGLSYVEENESGLKAVAIDGGDGCVEPSAETVQDGTYKPLSRPLYVYANRDSVEEKLQVDSFLAFILANQRTIARGARFVPLTQEQLDRSRTILEGAAIDAAVGDG